MSSPRSSRSPSAASSRASTSPPPPHGLPRQQACTLAVLMNTRGLTEIVILTIGLRAGILDQRLYSLMVVMALATTTMTGPLLDAISGVRWRNRDRPRESARQGSR